MPHSQPFRDDDTLVRWWTGKNAAGDVHIVPTNDLYEHHLSGDCPCGVHAEGAHPSEYHWVHDSYDGREAYETGERKKS